MSDEECRFGEKRQNIGFVYEKNPPSILRANREARPQQQHINIEIEYNKQHGWFSEMFFGRKKDESDFHFEERKGCLTALLVLLSVVFVAMFTVRSILDGEGLLHVISTVLLAIGALIAIFLAYTILCIVVNFVIIPILESVRDFIVGLFKSGVSRLPSREQLLMLIRNRSAMKRFFLFVVLPVSTLFVLYLIAASFRYREIGTNQGFFFRIDRWTGKTYKVAPYGIYEIHEDGIHRGR